MSETGPDEYPDGSVGRYVRERWAAAARPAGGRREGDDDEQPADEQQPGGSHTTEQPGIGARRDETWGVLPEDRGWGSDLLELEGELDDPFADPDDRARPGAQEIPRQAAATGGELPDDSAGGAHRAPGSVFDDPYGAPTEPPHPAGGPADDPAPREPTSPDPAPHGYANGTTPNGAPPNGSPANGTAPNGTAPNGSPTAREDVRPAPEQWRPGYAEPGPSAEQDSSTGPNSSAGPDSTGPDYTGPDYTDPGYTGPDTYAGPDPYTGPDSPSGPGTSTGPAAYAGPPTIDLPSAPPPVGHPPVTPPAPAGSPGPWARPTPPARTEEPGPPRRTRVEQGDPPADQAYRGRPSEAPTPPDGTPARPVIRDVGRWTDPGAVAAQEAQRARSDEQVAEVVATDLSTARLLKPSKRRPPRRGWRRFLYLLSARTINPGEGPLDVRERELVARVNQALVGCHKIATLSLKGGVGKTTITATLGATFASLRGDRVVAVDANPDRGTLSQKIPLETSATVRHLLRDSQRVRRYTDVRAYTSQGPSRLEVLASEQDPAVSEAFSEDDYRRTVTLLEHFYNIVLTDCGTGLMHSAMYGVLGVADQLIIVSSGSIDGARSASATMDWLEAHERGDLVRNAVAVINNVHRQAGAVDLDRVAQHFAGRCRAVIQIPFDPHLEEGAEVDLERLGQPTRLALLELAASVADGFPS